MLAALHRLHRYLTGAPSLPTSVTQTELPELQLKSLMRWKHSSLSLGNTLTVPSSARRAGQYLSGHKGRGMELSEIRNYQPGDDIRLMDWKVTARTQRPHTKVFLEERDRPVFLYADMSASMLFGSQRSKAEQAANCISLLGWACSQQGDRCGGLIFNGSHRQMIRPSAGSKAMLQLLQQCSEMGKQLPKKHSSASPGRINQLLNAVHTQLSPGSLIIMASDFLALDLSQLTSLYQLGRQHQLVMLFMYDPLEHTLLPAPVMLTSGQHSDILDGRYPEHQLHYRQQFDQRCQALREAAKYARALFIPIATTDSLPEKLQPFFPRRNR